MKQQGRGRKLTSLLLAFAMVIGMLSGPVFVKQTAQAAEGDNIALGELESHGTYYTYPDASVIMTDTSKKFYDMTVMVDSGYFKIPHSQMAGIKGTGLDADGELTAEDVFNDVSTSNEYSAVMFSWKDGIDKSKLEEFIGNLQFVTTEAKSQVVSISATTLGNDDQVAKVNGKNVYLKYFNGHFYGLANEWCSWSDAYTYAKTADFYGVTGYLATITSRAEDRFILTNWNSENGWMGCTRAKLLSYDTNVPEWEELAVMKSDHSDTELDGFIWKWVNGPEQDQRFGYQNLVGGNGHDGGFKTDSGAFSNWKEVDNNGTQDSEKSEPNGGGTSYNTDEAFGYYGRYSDGRWNDNPNGSEKKFYIEFGGNDGDDQKLKEHFGEVIYSATKDSDSTYADGTEGKLTLAGEVYIENKDPYDNCNVGTILEADVEDIFEKSSNADLTEDDLSYQWMRQDKNGVPVPIDGATEKTYTLTEEDLGNKLVVWVTAEKTDSDGVTQTHLAKSNPYDTTKGKKSQKLDGSVTIEEEENEQGNAVLTANIDDIKPEGAKKVLDYQWSIYDPDEDKYYKIDEATDPTYEVPENDRGKQFVVTVTPNEETGEDYEGEVVSMPYTVPQKDPQKEPIKGVVVIENKTTDDAGEPINKAGTVLFANADGITPEGAQPTLTYQWFVTDDNGVFQKIPGAVEKNYILTEDDINRKVAVTAYADEDKYTGSVSAVPYDTTRTNADIDIDPNPSDDPDDEWRIIKITPTAKDTVYTVWEFGTETTPTYIVVTDDDGNELQPIAEGDDTGYYKSDLPGGILYFKVRKDKAYDIREKLTVHENTEHLGIHIDDKDIKTEYDKTSDTIGITVDPAKEDHYYALLQKVDGEFVPVHVSQDENGNYVYADQTDGNVPVWTNGGDDPVNFTELPADGTYRIVAIPSKTEDGTDIDPDKVDPKEVNDGSNEVNGSKIKEETEGLPIDDKDTKTEYDKNTDTITIAVDPAKPDYKYAILKKENGEYKPITVSRDENGYYTYDEKGDITWSAGDQDVVTYTKLPSDGTYRIVAVPITADNATPGNQTNGSSDIDASKIKQDALGNQNPNASQSPNGGTQYTKAEEDKAEKFIKDYVTDAKKKLITKVDDSTKDIILSGESTWKKMTAREKAAVNAKLKAKGCPYTYEQLLKMAKNWKIPSFNMKKVMKKGTKSKLKMIKCKGATIITTTSNKKVGTISKKGVIKAKKVGKANLTITAVKGKYTNRLTIRLVVKKKFKNAKELKKLKAKQIKTPTLLLNKQRQLNKSTKIGIKDLKKGSKVKYKSFNKKNFTINKKGKYKAKRLGSSLIRTTVKQNNKTYILYLYLTGIKQKK